MPRDSAGVFTLDPNGNPVQTGTQISSSWANDTLSDIAQAITDSLDRNGRGGMIQPLEFADGTVALPGITWAGENNSGFYRSGNGDMRVSILGQDTFRWDTNGSWFWDGGAWVLVGTGGGGSGDVPNGTVNYQTLTWNNPGGAWVATSVMTTNYSTATVTVNGTLIATQITEGGTSLVAKYLGIANTAADSALLNGQPGSYYLDAGNMTGTIPDSALGGPYSIDITGNAATATTATNATNANNANLLDSQDGTYYLAYTNFTGTIPDSALAGPYSIDITGNAATATLATNATNADSATNAGNADTVDNYHVVVGPQAGDPNTIYFVI